MTYKKIYTALLAAHRKRSATPLLPTFPWLRDMDMGKIFPSGKFPQPLGEYSMGKKIPASILLFLVACKGV
jgi:hypothetical protein